MEMFVHGLFKDEKLAASAVQALIDAHFDPSQVSALMRVHAEVDEEAPKFKVEMVSGAALGALLGMIGGAVILSGGLLIAGPVAATLEGALAGAVAGWAGGISHWKDVVKFPKLGRGAVILVGAMTSEQDVERARAALSAAHAERIHASKKEEALEEIKTGVLSETGILGV